MAVNGVGRQPACGPEPYATGNQGAGFDPVTNLAALPVLSGPEAPLARWRLGLGLGLGLRLGRQQRPGLQQQVCQQGNPLAEPLQLALAALASGQFKEGPIPLRLGELQGGEQEVTGLLQF